MVQIGQRYLTITAGKRFVHNLITNFVKLMNCNNIVLQVFVANFDDTSPSSNYFKQAIEARYIKVIPLRWHNAIALQLEVKGCFENYLPPSTTIAPIVTVPPVIISETCQSCPNLPSESMNAECQCQESQYWNGDRCVPLEQCPCYIGYMKQESILIYIVHAF